MLLLLAQLGSAIGLALSLASAVDASELANPKVDETDGRVSPDSETETAGRTALPPTVAHAAGRFGGLALTNSLEAIRANAPRYELMELDLLRTSDGRFVCLHDWELTFTELFGRSVAKPLDFDAFGALGSPRGLTPCTAATLPTILEELPALDLVIHVRTDRVGAFKRLAESVPSAHQRLLPQAYSPEEITALRIQGYERVIWTLYGYPKRHNYFQIMKFARNRRLYAVTMPLEMSRSALLDRLVESGLRVYVHTVNDCETARSLRARGAQIYSDDLSDDSCS